MKPYVIDRSKLNLFIIFAVLLIIASFVSGYYWALYRTGNMSSVYVIEPSDQPEPNSLNRSEIDPVIVNSESQGSKTEATPLNSAQTEKKIPAKASKKTTTRTPIRQSVSGSTPSSKVKVSNKASITNQGKYSVQAGMFGSLTNANKFLEQLQSAGFAAYMQPHQAPDGVIRYNVRFGQFASKADAEQRLTTYKKGFSTPAYVIVNP